MSGYLLSHIRSTFICTDCCIQDTHYQDTLPVHTLSGHSFRTHTIRTLFQDTHYQDTLSGPGTLLGRTHSIRTKSALGHAIRTLSIYTQQPFRTQFQDRQSCHGVLIPSTHLPELPVCTSEVPESEEREVGGQLETREVPHQVPVHRRTVSGRERQNIGLARRKHSP